MKPEIVYRPPQVSAPVEKAAKVVAEPKLSEAEEALRRIKWQAKERARRYRQRKRLGYEEPT